MLLTTLYKALETAAGVKLLKQSFELFLKYEKKANPTSDGSRWNVYCC